MVYISTPGMTYVYDVSKKSILRILDVIVQNSTKESILARHYRHFAGKIIIKRQNK